MRLLLVEDDPLLGDGLQTALRRAGYTVDWLADGAEALAALRGEPFGLVVLDLGLPRLDGVALIRQLRAGGGDAPILVLTARDRLGDRIEALDAGADDFLAKPFEIDELLARLRALTRRRDGRLRNQLVFGDVVLDPQRFEATVGGQRLDLPRREFLLLRALVEAAGRLVSRERLQQALYGWDEDVASNTIEVHVHHLRRKLGAERIRTVRGVGYVLEPPR